MSGLAVRSSTGFQLSELINPLIAVQKNRLFNRVESVGFMALTAMVVSLASLVGVVATENSESGKTSSKKNRFFKGLGGLSAGGLVLALIRMVQLALKANRAK